MKGMWKIYQKQKLFINEWRLREFIIWDLFNFCCHILTCRTDNFSLKMTTNIVIHESLLENGDSRKMLWSVVNCCALTTWKIEAIQQ